MSQYIHIPITLVLVVIAVLMLSGCSFNAYRQPHFEFDRTLMPLEEWANEQVHTNYCAAYG